MTTEKEAELELHKKRVEEHTETYGKMKKEMEMATKLKTGEGMRVKGVCEILENAIHYDSIYFRAGECYTSQNFFTTTIGMNFPRTKIPKTFTHTNNLTGGFIGGIGTFTIDRFYMTSQDLSSKTDLKNLLKGHGVLMINQKEYPSKWPIETYLGFVVFDTKRYACGILKKKEDEWETWEADDENLRHYKDIKGADFSRHTNPFAKDVTIDTLENYRVELVWDSPGFTPEKDFILTIKMFGEMRRAVC